MASIPFIPQAVSRRSAFSPGFTYIELIAVIVILGGILALVAPRFSGLWSAYLKTDSRRIATMTRYAHESSVTKKVYVRMTFDLDNETITVDASPDGEEFVPASDPALRPLALRTGVELGDITLPGPGKVKTGTVEVFFSPAGSVEPFTLHLSRGSAVRTLEYNPFSGKVKVMEGYL